MMLVIVTVIYGSMSELLAHQKLICFAHALDLANFCRFTEASQGFIRTRSVMIRNCMALVRSCDLWSFTPLVKWIINPYACSANCYKPGDIWGPTLLIHLKWTMNWLAVLAPPTRARAVALLLVVQVPVLVAILASPIKMPTSRGKMMNSGISFWCFGDI